MNQIESYKINCNAQMIKNVCYPAPSIPMLRYETAVDFCINEPALIHIYPNDFDDKVVCEQILHIAADFPNDRLVAYTLYSNEREGFSSECFIALKQTCWDKKIDIKKLSHFPEKRKEHLTSFPSVSSKYNVFIISDAMINVITELDKEINRGIVLSRRRAVDCPIWRDIEIMRRYDWGEIWYNWGTEMQNNKVEIGIFKTMSLLDIEIDVQYPVINKMELDYKFPINDYYKHVYGV